VQGPRARPLRPLRTQARRNGEVAAAEERRALLGSGDPLARMREREGRDGLVGTAAAATASLQRTRQLMAQARSPRFGGKSCRCTWFMTASLSYRVSMKS